MRQWVCRRMRDWMMSIPLWLDHCCRVLCISSSKGKRCEPVLPFHIVTLLCNVKSNPLLLLLLHRACLALNMREKWMREGMTDNVRRGHTASIRRPPHWSRRRSSDSCVKHPASSIVTCSKRWACWAGWSVGSLCCRPPRTIWNAGEKFRDRFFPGGKALHLRITR